MEKEFVTQIYCFLKGSVYGKKGENCLKRLILKNVAFIQIQRVAYTTGIVKNQFNFKKIIEILQPIVIDHFSTQ